MFTPERAILEEVGGFFGLAAGFPSSRLVARSPTARSLLLVSDEVLALLRADVEGQLRVVNTGVRIFEREEARGTECAYRACQDGLNHLVPFQSSQRLECTAEAAAAVLRAKGQPGLTADDLKGRAELVGLHEQLSTRCKPGSVVLTHVLPEDAPLTFVTLYAPSGSLSAMVKGPERQVLLFRLGATAPGDTTDNHQDSTATAEVEGVAALS